MVLVLLGPADENAAVAVQPGVAGLDDPAACFPLGVLRLLLDLLAACADVLRALDRDRVQRPLQQLVVVAVRAVVIEPERNPRSLGEDRTLRPPLALSVGFGPVLAPPSGALLIAPSPDRNDQSMPTTSSYSKSP